MNSISPNLNLMIKSCEKVSKVLIRDFGEVEKLQVSIKGPKNFVTNSDKKVEDMLVNELSKSKKKYSFLTEESGFIKNEDKENEKTYFHVLDAHLLHFSVAKEIWKDNKLFGAGVRSFQRICGNYDYLETFNKSKSCSTHPHNILIQIILFV